MPHKAGAGKVPRILPTTPLDISSAVTPSATRLHDPSRQPPWGIGHPIRPGVGGFRPSIRCSPVASMAHCRRSSRSVHASPIGGGGALVATSQPQPVQLHTESELRCLILDLVRGLEKRRGVKDRSDGELGAITICDRMVRAPVIDRPRR
jgi:hypothetical protein